MNYTTVHIRLLQTAVIPSGCHSNMQYLHISLINKYVLLCVTSSPASERGHSPKSLSDAAQCGACSPCNIACVYCATHPNPTTQYQAPPTVRHTMYTHKHRHGAYAQTHWCICTDTFVVHTHPHPPHKSTQSHTLDHKRFSTYASISVCNWTMTSPI